jgi:SpoVK/Ycf46/Vps4 family AAA+-type ATPase
MEPTKKTIDFIGYLDSYKSKKQCKYNDYLNLLYVINYNYGDNNIYDEEIVGYNYNSSVIRNINNYSAFESKNIQKSEYSIWQSKHEVDIAINVVKKKINIDVNIDSLDDLIRIVNDNEYYENCEYNIDLKSIHNVKNEILKLNSMIGMDSLKKSIVDQMLYFVQGLHKGINISEYKHTVLYGPPGTGKTEVAKIIGEMYSKLGILKNNVFKKVTRSDLIAGYLGQTALKTKKVIDECIGGVLFIDEAYSLASSDNNDSYSKECIDTICEALSDRRDDLMVIIAGYEVELNETFFRVNRGLESRFIWRFKMDKYTPLEMMKIFKKKVNEIEWSFEDENALNEKWFNDKKDNFQNFGRDMELLLSYVKICHGRRIYGKDSECKKKISFDDVNKGYEIFINNKNKKVEPTFMHSIYV